MGIGCQCSTPNYEQFNPSNIKKQTVKRPNSATSEFIYKFLSEGYYNFGRFYYIYFNPYVNTPKHFCSKFWETVPKEIFQAPSLEILGGCKVSRLDPQQVTSSAQPFPVSLSLFAPIFPKYLSPLCTLNTYTPHRLCAKYIQQWYAQSKDYCARSH